MSLAPAQRSVLEARLSAAVGYPLRLGRGRQLRPGRIFRLPVRPAGRRSLPAETPQTIIAKVVPPSERTTTTARQFANEVAALDFLAAFRPEVAPRLLVADLDHLVLAMEDLGSLPSLSDVPFPNCWCWRRLPDSVTVAMLRA